MAHFVIMFLNYRENLFIFVFYIILIITFKQNVGYQNTKVKYTSYRTKENFTMHALILKALKLGFIIKVVLALELCVFSCIKINIS